MLAIQGSQGTIQHTTAPLFLLSLIPFGGGSEMYAVRVMGSTRRKAHCGDSGKLLAAVVDWNSDSAIILFGTMMDLFVLHPVDLF